MINPFIVILVLFGFIFGGAYYLDQMRIQASKKDEADRPNVNRSSIDKRSAESGKNNNANKVDKSSPSNKEFQSFEEYDDFFDVDDEFFEDYSKDLEDK